MRLTPKQAMVGMGAYFVAAVGGYLYLRSAKAPAPTPGCGCGGRHAPGDAGEQEGAAHDGQATFDRLADEVRRQGYLPGKGWLAAAPGRSLLGLGLLNAPSHPACTEDSASCLLPGCSTTP